MEENINLERMNNENGVSMEKMHKRGIMGAIIGDIVGSRFEFEPHKSKEFELFTYYCRATDDSMMTIAIANALLDCKDDYSGLSKRATDSMQAIGRMYPDAGYGGRFIEWLYEDDPLPYESFGNGAAMRVSPCAFAADTLEQALSLSDAVTRVSHNHPEGMKGARALTAAIYLAKTGHSKEEIREHIARNYYPNLRTLDEIRPGYSFNVTCQGSVPEALECFFEADSYEDTIRNAVSLGGDCDTQGAIAGAIAGTFYGIPDEIYEEAIRIVPPILHGIIHRFGERFEQGL